LTSGKPRQSWAVAIRKNRYNKSTLQ